MSARVMAGTASTGTTHLGLVWDDSGRFLGLSLCSLGNLTGVTPHEWDPTQPTCGSCTRTHPARQLAQSLTQEGRRDTTG